MIKLNLTIYFLLASFLISQVAAQSKNAFFVSAGKSFHGTGDLKGIAVDVMHEHNLNKRLSWSNSLTTTIHYKIHRGLNNNNSSQPSLQDNLMRFTTAGIQLNSHIDLTLINFSDNKIKLEVGPMLRFQSSSYPTSFGIHQENNFPYLYYVVNYNENYNTISPGYNVSLSYITNVSYKYKAGFKATFQNDTRSDVITSLSLIFGTSLF
jgi:hypothetical protein